MYDFEIEDLKSYLSPYVRISARKTHLRDDESFRSSLKASLRLPLYVYLELYSAVRKTRILAFKLDFGVNQYLIGGALGFLVGPGLRGFLEGGGGCCCCWLDPLLLLLPPS